MRDFKPAPKVRHKHKNLTQDDLEKRLDQVFDKEDNHKEYTWVNFDEDYNLDPEETIEKLEKANYKTQKHSGYPNPRSIKVTLNTDK